ncbi:hypothetical protein [Hyunsoonleella pacifica]|uniref:Uncharacterized protein n=1 Tax=Hyunsoonleella pacifica TaxID=1080224 RepID=A0A4Q9FMS5_9FLAO|nr:hypothetical protein [Hyunsoonleella pacifica]TBN13127.1 hypothetical protein EYD46_16660 [Hyunsoonleella pacifica]GGD28384.1 hypothetical protein GCM10011368_32970 [Hyunsoonleella pacifica]
MNIETLDVQIMNIQEITEIEGGGWFTDFAEDVGYAVGYAVGVAAGTVVTAVHILTHEAQQ